METGYFLRAKANIWNIITHILLSKLAANSAYALFGMIHTKTTNF